METGREARPGGRPRATERSGFAEGFGAVLERLLAGKVSRRRAARELGVGYATLKRLLDGRNRSTTMGQPEKMPESQPDPLTRIHAAYTLSTTPEGDGEVEALVVKDFLNTLAEVALAIAARETKKADR